MNQVSMCVNVALGKKATQSSLSPWSVADDAAGAVSGTLPADFGFHTEKQLNPWWMVDLEYQYPIDRIVIHNRLDGMQGRAQHCRIEISADQQDWELIHAGRVHFAGGDTGAPLILPMLGQIRARYVRISLDTEEYLHLAQVEVFANPAAKIRDRFNLWHMPFAGDLVAPGWQTYTVEGQAPADITGALTGLKLKPIGRLGNQLVQFTQAIAVARRAGLRYIRTLNHGLINLPEPITLEGITFLPPDAEAPEPGPFLTGNFFFDQELSPLLDIFTKFEQYYIVHDLIRPHFMKAFPEIEDRKRDDEITIHLRAGDVFNAAPSGYTQPPLAFYRVLIKFGIEQKLFNCVRLVFEDRDNPCIDGLIAFLQTQTIPYRLQSGTLVEDLTALIDAPHLAFGFGTFGLAVSLLSQHPATVFCMEGLSHNVYDGLPSVKKTIVIRDRDGNFTKPGEWRNTPEQNRMMIEYPDSALEVLQPNTEPPAAAAGLRNASVSERLATAEAV